jgi:type II secretory pathway pseudopilin PulG
MLKRVLWLRRMKQRQVGATLLEVMIAIIVLGLVVASIPAAVMAIHNAQNKQNEQRIAENLARYEIEYIKSQNYVPGNCTTTAEFNQAYDLGTPMRGGYIAIVDYYPINPEDYTRYDRGNTTNPQGFIPAYVQDDGIQEIVVTVFGPRGQQLGSLYQTIDYKVLR